MDTITPYSIRLLQLVLLCCIISSCRSYTEKLQGFEVHGIDVSHHQGKVDWDTINKQELHFAIIKSTEGENFKDSLFKTNWASIGRSKLSKGAYHFFRASTNPELQFQNYKSTVILSPGDLPPVLDVELIGDSSPAELLINLETWLKMAEVHYNVKPIIYTYQKFYNQYLAGKIKDYPLWIARYHTIEPELEDNNKWTLWQYGDRGQLPGIEGLVDFNVFKGSIEDFNNLLIPQDSITSPVSSY